MSNYDLELQEYKGKLSSQIAGIEKILRLNTNDLLDNEVTSKIGEIKEKAERLLKKLETNEFEISIVGLEKAGKSSFANAIIGNDILPSKEARCTYTSTSIRYGDNRATVRFFSKQEFAKGFEKNLQLLGIEQPGTYDYETLSLQRYEDMFEGLDDITKQRWSGTVNEDIKDILRYKNILKDLVGRGTKEFRGEEELRNDVKKYIEDPSYAIAVKEIVIESDKLERMKNAIIYDVPGFDSPTQMHKEQTLEKMRAADAIILIASAYKPSFTGPVVDIFRNESDEDGIRFGDKMFVFANMADRAENLDANMRDICNDLKKHNIMSESRFEKNVIAGSARARLEADGKVEGTMAIDGLKGKEDGIDCITHRLEEYNQTERFEVLKGKINRLQSDIRTVFENQFTKSEYSGGYSGGVLAGRALEIVDESRKIIKEAIVKYRNEFRREYSPEKHPLSDQMKETVIRDISVDRFGVTDEEFEIACNKSNQGIREGVVNTRVEETLREEKQNKIYNAFADAIVQLALNEYKKCDENLVAIIEEGMGISKGDRYYDELDEKIKRDFFNQKLEGDDHKNYYKSLIERFSADLFTLLIDRSFGDESRWDYFEKGMTEFYSLSMYSNSFDSQSSPGEQALHYRLLFHSDEQKTCLESKNEIIKMLTERLVDIVLDPKILDYIKIIVSVERENAIGIVQKMLKRLDANPNRDKKNFIMDALENIVEKYEDQKIDIPNRSLSKEYYQAYFNGRREKSSDDVRNEIDEDIRILQEVLEDTVVNAIRIEIPFLAHEMELMNNLIEKVEGAEYRNFVKDNITLICADECADLEQNVRRQAAYEGMMEEINKILEEMKHVNDKRSNIGGI